MQKNYFFKAVFTLLLCSFFSLSYAADFYISSAGNDDTGDGSVGTPWASFSKAQNAAADGDVIHVSGMIDFTLDPANTTTNTGTTTGNLAGIIVSKNITLQGTSPESDGFLGTNGSNTTRFFQITNAARTLTLKNLKLANGVAQSTTLAAGGGAISMTTGNIVAENVIFDGNSAIGYNAITGGAIYIGGTNANSTSFTNCLFSNNASDKAGAIYVNVMAASSALIFEGCSFISNKANNVSTTGGSALYLRTNTENTTVSIINCTFAKNQVLNSGTGGTVNMVKSGANSIVNIINSTFSENTTIGAVSQSAGVYVLSNTGNFLGRLNIYNSILEGNTATGGAYSDLCIANVAPIVPPSTGGVPSLMINNSIIGRYASSTTVPTACYPTPNYFNYLTNTSTTNNFKANLTPFNATNNSYSLYVGSAAIDYGNSSLLSSYSITDQLGNTRTVGANNYAGSVEATPVTTTTPDAPTALVATAGDGQVSVAFKSAATGGSAVSNYKYSTDNGVTYTACNPIVTAGPILITGLTNDIAYTVKIKAVNANGDGAESVASNSATPTIATGFDNALKNSISIYKNSNNQIVVINASQKAGTITVCNTIGQRVVNMTLNASSTTLNKSFTSGVYLVMISIDGKTSSTKIIL